MKAVCFAILAICVTSFALTPAAAKKNKPVKEAEPVNGSWQILPIAMEAPLIIPVGKESTVLLHQPIVPEAIRIASAPLTVGTLAIAKGDVLFRATTKQGTAWCALDPLRALPEAKTQSGLAKALLGKVINPPGADTLCLGDADGDGAMESAMTGSSKGYLLPIITKLGPATPIAPVATSVGDPATIAGWQLELSASASTSKDKSYIVYRAMLRSSKARMSIEGFRLLATERLIFAILGNVATVETKFDSVTPARVIQGATGSDGRIEMRIESPIIARSLTLGEPTI